MSVVYINDFSRIFSLFYQFLDNFQCCIICQYIISSRSSLSKFQEELFIFLKVSRATLSFYLHCGFNVFADLIE